MIGLVLVPLCLRGQLDSAGLVDLMRRLEVRDILDRLHRLVLSASITREEVGA
jgi:hypothetical protein